EEEILIQKRLKIFLNDDSIPLGVEDSLFNMEEDILFLESLLNEDPSPPHLMIPNMTKSLIEEPNTKNLIPIPHESEVTSDNGIESNYVESTSNHDTVKFDNLDEFSGPLIPIYIVEEERIRREHADYINRMEMLFTINPRPHPSTYSNTNVECFYSLPIRIQESDPHQEEIDIIISTDDVLPPSVENDDSDGEVDAVDDLHINNSIQNSEHEFSESEDSDFDNPSVPLPPLEPPNEEFDFEIYFRNEYQLCFLYSPLRVRTRSLTLDLPPVIEVFLCWIFVPVSKIFASFDLKLVWGRTTPYTLTSPEQFLTPLPTSPCALATNPAGTFLKSHWTSTLSHGLAINTPQMDIWLKISVIKAQGVPSEYPRGSNQDHSLSINGKDKKWARRF
nr:hypothetical protein [Tanacetum cinerariifolium]